MELFTDIKYSPSIKSDEIRCRTCLTEECIMKYVFSTVDNFYNESTTIADMLMLCTSVQVIEGDGLPDQVCLQCVDYITKAFSFKKLCEQSDAMLREFLNKQSVTNEDINSTALSVIEQKPIEIINFGEETMKDDISEPSTAIIDNSVHEVTTAAVDTSSPSAKEKIAILNSIQRLQKETKKEQIQGDTEQLKYSCKKCTACFTSSTDLKAHSCTYLKSNCRVCEKCNKKFKSLSSLYRHMYVRVHDSTRCHLCSECGKIIVRPDDFARHLRVHTGEKPYVCKECGKALTDSGKLLEHMRAHANKKSFICSECGKGFSRHAGLVAHRKTHSGIKSHACNVCGKRLSGSGALKIHMKTHTGLRDYVCSHCDKGFTTRSNLVTHERTHTGERPHVCNICGKGFHNKSNLIAHSQSHRHESIHTREKPS